MGICESAHSGKPLATGIIQEKPPQIDPKDQTIDYQNGDLVESGVRPSIFNQTDYRISSNQQSKIYQKPELAKYERSLYQSGKKSEFSDHNNKTSIFSSGRSEEEIIIKGEINKEAKNREEDFANNSFKQLVKNQGGIILNNNDSNDSLKANYSFDLSKGNISEIYSKQISPLNYGNRKSNKDSSLSSNKYRVTDKNVFSLIDNNNNALGIISGKYDTKGNLVPNGNTGIIYNKEINKQITNNNNLIGVNINNKSRENNNRINISLHESSPRIDSFLNVPSNDQPSPDMDELSGSLLKN